MIQSGCQNVEKGRNALNYGLYLINMISGSKGQHDKVFDIFNPNIINMLTFEKDSFQ